MRYVSTDDPLDNLFAAARELEPTDAEVRGVLKRARGRRPRLTGRTARLVVVIAVIVVSSVAVAAAAVKTVSALTGIFVHEGARNAKAIGTGEAIALGASGDVSAGIKLTGDIRFAPGYESWRAREIAFQTGLQGGSPAPGQAFMTSSALRWQVAESAFCSWLDYYVASQAVGNSAAAASAAVQIKAAPGWPAITGLDYPSGLGASVAAVGARDAKLVRALIETGQTPCTNLATPFPPTGVTVAEQRARIAVATRRGRAEIATDPIARRLGITATP